LNTKYGVRYENVYSCLVGILVQRYDYSEAQNGKSYCDAKIAHMRGKIRKSVAEGKCVDSRRYDKWYI
jgi:hypothetical protein